jgi:hypothetical protein
VIKPPSLLMQQVKHIPGWGRTYIPASYFWGRTSENAPSTTFMNKAVAFCIRATVPATNLPAPATDLGRLSESLGSPGEGKPPEEPQEGAQEEQEGGPE